MAAGAGSGAGAAAAGPATIYADSAWDRISESFHENGYVTMETDSTADLERVRHAPSWVLAVGKALDGGEEVRLGAALCAQAVEGSRLKLRIHENAVEVEDYEFSVAHFVKLRGLLAEQTVVVHTKARQEANDDRVATRVAILYLAQRLAAMSSVRCDDDGRLTPNLPQLRADCKRGVSNTWLKAALTAWQMQAESKNPCALLGEAPMLCRHR
jgi:hypothetical protein